MEMWLPILEYARYKKISISTIRRYIKAQRVKYKIEAGKYFILVPNYKLQEENSNDISALRLENENLKLKIQTYEEEISALKMLTSLYETKTADLTQRLS